MSSTRAEWLQTLRSDIEAITHKAALAYWPGQTPEDPPYYNYRLEHVRQVERDALRLLEVVGGDVDIVLASVWIHDRFQPQYHDTDHPREAADWAHSQLAALGFPEDKVASVCFAVANHSNPPGTLPESAHEARVLWDADKLSKHGALRIIAYLTAAPAFPHNPIGFLQIARRGLEQIRNQGDTAELFYFPESRLWARTRQELHNQFYEGLARELGILA